MAGSLKGGNGEFFKGSRNKTGTYTRYVYVAQGNTIVRTREILNIYRSSVRQVRVEIERFYPIQ